MSVIYDAKKKEWIVPWKAASGRLLREAFATRKEAVAFEQAQALIARREREILKKKKKLQTPDSKITIREIIRRYLVQAQIKDSTRASSTYHSAPVIAAFGNRRATLLSKQDILNFAEAQRLRGVRQTTISLRISVLRSTLTWAEDNNLISRNPLKGMTFPKGKSRRISPPTPAEAKALLENAPPHIQRVIIIGWFLGPRIGPSELLKMTWFDFFLQDGFCRMPNAEKGSREESRDVPIRNGLLPWFKAWKEADEQAGVTYVIHWHGRPVTDISTAWHAARKRAGIARRIRPYDLRHAYASNALLGGAGLKPVSANMGNSPLTVAATYQNVQFCQLREAVEVVNDFLGLSESWSGPLPGLMASGALKGKTA